MVIVMPGTDVLHGQSCIDQDLGRSDSNAFHLDTVITVLPICFNTGTPGIFAGDYPTLLRRLRDVITPWQRLDLQYFHPCQLNIELFSQLACLVGGYL